MPYRQRGSYSRRSFQRPIINSIKNVANNTQGLTGTQVFVRFAKAVTSPSPTVSTDVSHGCIIQAVYVTIDVCGLGGTGVLNVYDGYIIKNPGDNLTLPAPISIGSSNEKKFVFKQWRFMIMRNQDGNMPFHWEGWLKIPRRYQRMGTDDTLTFVAQCTSGVTGHVSSQFIYKWKR